MGISSSDKSHGDGGLGGKPASSSPIRQQLDDLDALLQRMLELPVNTSQEARVTLREQSQPPSSTGESTPADPASPSPGRKSRGEGGELPGVSEEKPVKPRKGEARPVSDSEQHSQESAWKNAQFEDFPLSGNPQAPEDSHEERSYPASYMVLESATPRHFSQTPRGDNPSNQRPPRDLVPPSAVNSPQESAGPDEPEEEEGDVWVPLRSSWEPSAHTWGPLAESWRQAQPPEPGKETVEHNEPQRSANTPLSVPHSSQEKPTRNTPEVPTPRELRRERTWSVPPEGTRTSEPAQGPFSPTPERGEPSWCRDGSKSPPLEKPAHDPPISEEPQNLRPASWASGKGLPGQPGSFVPGPSTGESRSVVGAPENGPVFLPDPLANPGNPHESVAPVENRQFPTSLPDPPPPECSSRLGHADEKTLAALAASNERSGALPRTRPERELPHTQGNAPGDSVPVPPSPMIHRDPFWLMPLIWFNQLFDLCLTPLGPLGRWLREPTGRAFLGMAGLVALAIAAVLFLAEGLWG